VLVCCVADDMLDFSLAAAGMIFFFFFGNGWVVRKLMHFCPPVYGTRVLARFRSFRKCGGDLAWDSGGGNS